MRTPTRSRLLAPMAGAAVIVSLAACQSATESAAPVSGTVAGASDGTALWSGEVVFADPATADPLPFDPAAFASPTRAPAEVAAPAAPAVEALGQGEAVEFTSAPAGSIEAVVAAHFGPVADQAMAIAECESHLNPNAVSRTNDHGLFQINHVHSGEFTAVTGQPWSAIYDVTWNTVYAKHLYDQSGWGPWACRRVL